MQGPGTSDKKQYAKWFLPIELALKELNSGATNNTMTITEVFTTVLLAMYGSSNQPALVAAHADIEKDLRASPQAPLDFDKMKATVLSSTKYHVATGGSSHAQAFSVRVKPTGLDHQHSA
jgi:hypothetical protein